MKIQQLLVVLTLANAALLTFSIAQPRRAAADAVAPVLRARAFELVDDHGRVRAELRVFPADPTVKMPDGTKGYPEAVLLRLITSDGAPNVKLVTTEDGAGLVTGGPSGYIQLLSRGTNPPFIKIHHSDGREQTMKP